MEDCPAQLPRLQLLEVVVRGEGKTVQLPWSWPGDDRQFRGGGWQGAVHRGAQGVVVSEESQGEVLARNGGILQEVWLHGREEDGAILHIQDECHIHSNLATSGSHWDTNLKLPEYMHGLPRLD